MTPGAPEPRIYLCSGYFLVVMLQSLLFGEPSQAEPSFSIFKNEPKRAFKFFRNLIDIFSMLDLSNFWQILNIFDQSFGWKWPSGCIVERKNWNFPIRTGLCQWSFSKFFKKLVLAEFFKPELLEKLSEPSRAFWPKVRAKTERNRAEPRLGSNTSTF